MTTSNILDNEFKTQVYKVENLGDHITNFVKDQYKDTTKSTYKYALTRFHNYIINTEIIELRQDNITNIVREYRGFLTENTSLKSGSIDSYITQLKAFLNQHLNLNPKKLRKLDYTKKQPKYIEFEEVQGLINTVQYITGNKEQIARDKAIICTLFTGGLRISELLNIKLEDYITRGDTSYLMIIGKGRALDTPESIAIPPQTTTLINDYLKERRHSKRTCKYLFCSLSDKQLTRQSVNKEVKRIAKEYDKRNNTNIAPRVSTHTFRHSLARYLLVEKGVPINQVKDILRHSNIETTAKYLTTTQEEITELRKGIIF